MPILIVVDDPKSWPLQIPDVELVSGRSYLADSSYIELRRARVFNLCRSYRYQSIGYYVSLLAAARGHRPIPSVSTLQDLKSQAIIRVASEELDDLIQRSLSRLQSKEFVLSVYFGHNLAKRYDQLSNRLFSLFQAPFLRAFFAFSSKSQKWYLQNVGPISANGIPAEHHPFVVEKAQEYFQGHRRRASKRAVARYDLAILVDPAEKEPPSNAKALHRFTKTAEAQGFYCELIHKEDYGRLAEFDALLIRETTAVNHHTYRFATRAAAEGLVVIDDPESILKCTNKVFLAELLDRRKIPIPKTLIVHRGNKSQIAKVLSLPCVLKAPDSSFSRGVIKVNDEEELKTAVAQMLERSDLIIAQEYVPTDFDWRVGIFDRQPLFACKYFMAPNHWQILRRDSAGKKEDEGLFETMPVSKAPSRVVKTALKAANLIGNGLYGVDLKEVNGRVIVVEINDNPNIDGGVEDKVLRSELYRIIIDGLMRRIEHRKGGNHT